MSVIDNIKAKAKSQKKHILLPEGTEERTVQASQRIIAEGIADVSLMGNEDEIRAVAEKFGVDLTGVGIIDPVKSPDFETYVERFYEMRKAKGVTPEKAADMIKNPLFFAAMMISAASSPTFFKILSRPLSNR